MLRRISILGACGVILLASALWAREGTVYVKNPKMNMHGDVTDRGNTVDVVNGGITTTFQKPNVAQIIYDDDVPNIISERLSKLGPTDVQGRIDLAQFAMDFKRYDDAKRILTDAQKIDPGNSRVSNMLANIDEMTQPPPQTAPANPNTPAAPGPAGPSQANRNTPAPTTSAAPIQLREVTPNEINKIRLAEWQEGQLKVHVRIDSDVRNQFIAESGISTASFLKLPLAQQAWQMWTKDPALASGIHMLGDPPALLQYRQVIHRQIITGCAASSCHGGDKAGSFRLFSGSDDPAVYTDFLILNKYGLSVEGRMYPMLNREQPQESLLLSEMLTPELALVPHPKAEGYRGMCKTKADPKYVVTLAWIRDALNPVRPTYDIDLTQPPPKTDKSAPPPGGGQ
ncbi:MAG TPA: tetratricopeptide repeat protein [Tepidisphaeraceae bacterium]|nr:tetratricopeptide repeat protein [Tepidisphaeraceae bacterium]